jgi:5'-nucleotidase
MGEKLEILIANDDGVDSPGIAAAIESALPFGNVSVIAPTSQKTAYGRSLVGSPGECIRQKDLVIGGTAVTAHYIDCSPALAVKHALNTVFKDNRFDLAISGINYGENIGTDITMSGTLGAAFEFAAAGIPAIAISRQTDLHSHHHYGDLDWGASRHFLALFIEAFARAGSFQRFDILKIDVPHTAHPNTEWKISRLLLKPYYRNFVPDGSITSRIGDGRLRINDGIDLEPGTDAHTLLYEEKVSVVPLTIDLTATGCEEFFTRMKRQ